MAALEIVSILAVLQLFFFGALVARARARYGIRAPAIAGHEMFERYFRVQMNTLEQLVLFLPAVWLAAPYVPALWIALLGLLYLAGRFLYLRAYVSDPSRRGPGFGLTVLPTLVLLLIGLIGSIIHLVR